MRSFHDIEFKGQFIFHHRIDLMQEYAEEPKLKRYRAHTIAVVFGPDYGCAVGITSCSVKDQFSKKKGILIATGRAKMEYALGAQVEFDKDNNKVMDRDEMFSKAQEIYHQMALPV